MLFQLGFSLESVFLSVRISFTKNRQTLTIVKYLIIRENPIFCFTNMRLLCDRDDLTDCQSWRLSSNCNHSLNPKIRLTPQYVSHWSVPQLVLTNDIQASTNNLTNRNVLPPTRLSSDWNFILFCSITMEKQFLIRPIIKYWLIIVSSNLRMVCETRHLSHWALCSLAWVSFSLRYFLILWARFPVIPVWENKKGVYSSCVRHCFHHDFKKPRFVSLAACYKSLAACFEPCVK